MGKSPYSVEERLSLIDACYKSGLSVHTWCADNSIPSGTFYSWMHYLKKAGHQLPETVPVKFREKPFIETHDVVRVDIVEEVPLPTEPARTQSLNVNNTSVPHVDSIRIHLGDVSLEIPEGINSSFLTQVIQSVRYSL